MSPHLTSPCIRPAPGPHLHVVVGPHDCRDVAQGRVPPGPGHLRQVVLGRHQRARQLAVEAQLLPRARHGAQRLTVGRWRLATAAVLCPTGNSGPVGRCRGWAGGRAAVRCGRVRWRVLGVLAAPCAGSLELNVWAVAERERCKDCLAWDQGLLEVTASAGEGASGELLPRPTPCSKLRATAMAVPMHLLA